MGINSTEVSYGFGQLGSGYLADTGALTPPEGMVIVAIDIQADTKFTLLTADVVVDAAYIGSAAQVALNGANSDAIGATKIFPKGKTLFGRWTACTLASGEVIVYYGR
jgi:nucleoid-associated protein YgaU